MRRAAADGALWCGPGDPLVRLLVVRPVSRDWLEEQAARLLQSLRASEGFTGGPGFAEIDCDEETVFAPSDVCPLSTELRLVQVGEKTLGGYVLFSNAFRQGFDDLLVGAEEAFAATFLLNRLQRRLDDSSDRLKEIAEVGRIFARVGEPERTLNRILDLAIRSSSAQIGALVHYDREGSLAAIGMQMDLLLGMRFAGGENVVERAVSAQGEAVYGSTELGRLLADGGASATMETLATFPLLHEGRTRGALILINVPETHLAEDPLVAMLSTVARLAAAAITGEERQRERLEQERTRQELRAARTIQQSLMPRTLPDVGGLRMAALWKPSRTLGGDFYDIFPLGPDRLGVVIADVSGKGLPAALLMAVTRSYLRVLAEEKRPPGEVLARVNARLAGEIADNRFVTANYMVIDMARRECALANAGHHAPALMSADGAITLMEADGLPLGVFAESEYPDAVYAFEPGSCLTFYTDGLPETKNASGHLLGHAGFLKLLQAGASDDPAKLLDRLWNATVAFGDQSEPLDDWTAVAIRFQK